MYSGDGERGGGRGFGLGSDSECPFPFHLSSSAALLPLLDAFELADAGGCVTAGLVRPDNV